MIQWPSVFPYVSRDGYKLERGDNLISSKMQSGLPRVRQQFETVPTMVTASFYATGPQGSAFEAWYQSALNGGSEWFEMPLVEPQAGNPQATALYRVKFLERYSGPSMFGASLWKYTLKIMALPMPDIIGPDYGLFPEYIIDANIFDVAMNRYWPEA